MDANKNHTVSIEDLEQEIQLRKAAEEKAKIAELNYRKILESINEAVAVCDIETSEIIDCNDAFLHLFRISKEKALNRILSDFSVGDPLFEQAHALERFWKAIEEEKLDFKWLATRSDSSRMYCDVSLKKASLWNKTCVLAFISDITRQKKEEEDLIQDLRNGEERYRNLVENSVTGIGVSHNGKILFANRALCELFGIEHSEELYAKDLLAYATEESKQKIIRRMEKLKAGEPVPAHFEHDIIRKDGEVRTLLLHVSDIHFGGKKCRQSTFIDITDKKRLQEIEKRFQVMFEKAPYALALTDMESGEIIDVNDMFSQKTGFEKESLIGHTTTKLGFYSQADRHQVVNHLMENGTAEGLEMRFQASSKTFHTRLFARLIAINNAQFVLTAFEDITEIKETQEQLGRNEERLRLALSNAKEGIWDWNLKTDEVYFDEGYYILAGYEPYEFPESVASWENRVHPDDIERSKQEIDRCIRDQGSKYDMEFRFLRKDKSWMWIRAMGKVTERDEDGTPCRFTGTHIDITDSKQAEIALQESEERFSLFMQFIPAVIFIKDIEGRVVFGNQRFAENLNMQPEDLIGKISDEYWPPDLRQKFDEENARVLKGETVISETTLPDRVNSKHFITYKFPLMKEGQPFYIGAIGLDITKQKEMENQLKAAMEQADAANKAKSEFLSNISHELRTPMQGILGFAKLAMHRFKTLSEKKKLEYFEEIQNSGSRLLKLLNNLLDLSRIESGKTEFEFKPERLTRLTDDAIKELHPIIDEKQLKLGFTKPSFDDTVPMDREKIGQVIRNLLGNAVKFTAGGGDIEITIAQKDSRVVFTIADSGVGIPDQELESIFDPFAQSSKTKTNAGGTGLGLSICKEIVAAHGGVIWAENRKSKGARFIFTLPLNR